MYLNDLSKRIQVCLRVQVKIQQQQQKDCLKIQVKVQDGSNNSSKGSRWFKDSSKDSRLFKDSSKDCLDIQKK